MLCRQYRGNGKNLHFGAECLYDYAIKKIGGVPGVLLETVAILSAYFSLAG